MNFGFDVDYKQSRLVLDLNLDFNKTKRAAEGRGAWEPDMKTHFASMEVTYGLKFPRKSWLLVPYAGYSLNEFTPAKSDDEDKRRITGHSLVVGLEVSRSFKSKNDSYECVFFFYKLRASVNPSNFVKNYSGTQANVKLSVGFDAAKMKRRLLKKS